MGSSGIKRRKPRRPDPPISPVGADDPLGGAPAPWGPVGRIQATGRIFRAARWGSGRQRRAGIILAAVCFGPILIAAIGGIVVTVSRALGHG